MSLWELEIEVLPKMLRAVTKKAATFESTMTRIQNDLLTMASFGFLVTMPVDWPMKNQP